MGDITKRLKSQNTVVGVLVLALLAQMPHAQHVFYASSHAHDWFGWVQSWGGAIALEVAVLVFVIRGNIKVSWGFASFSVAINLMYYYNMSLAPYLSPVLLSIGLPLAIALYSHEVADKGEKVDPTPVTQPVVQVQNNHEIAVIEELPTIEVQPVVEDETQLDELDMQIVEAVRNGHNTPYAISKVVSCSLTTLKRKKDDAYIGRIPNLVAAGVLCNSSGADGNEYRLAEV